MRGGGGKINVCHNACLLISNKIFAMAKLHLFFVNNKCFAFFMEIILSHACSLLLFTPSCAFFHIALNLGLLQTNMYISARIIGTIDNGECYSTSIIDRAKFSLF